MKFCKPWVFRIGLLFILFIFGPPLLLADNCSVKLDCFGSVAAAAAASAAAGALAGGAAFGAQRRIMGYEMGSKMRREHEEYNRSWQGKLDWFLLHDAYRAYARVSGWVGGVEKKSSLPAGKA